MKPHNVQPWFIHYLPPAVSIKSIHTTGLKMYWNACTFTQQVTWLNCYLKTGRNRKYNSFLFCLQYGLDGRLRSNKAISTIAHHAEIVSASHGKTFKVFTKTEKDK